MLSAGDVWPICKQMTPLSIAAGAWLMVGNYWCGYTVEKQTQDTFYSLNLPKRGTSSSNYFHYYYYYLGYFCACIWFTLSLDTMLCHCYYTIMLLLLLLVPCFNRLRLKIRKSVINGSSSLGGKKPFSYKCCWLQAQVSTDVLLNFISFIIRNVLIISKWYNNTSPYSTRKYSNKILISVLLS